MREAGLTGIDSTRLSVVGIAEVLTKLPSILGAFSGLKRMLRSERFDCVVLIDYPDFNLRFAKAAKKSGVPVVYYISPQVWAWRRGRIKKIAALVRKMLVVFPFEAELYREAGLDAEYVGHPLAGQAACGMTGEEARERLGLGPDGAVVAVLPGSRVDEIRRHLGPMLEGVELLAKRLSRPVEVVLPLADGIDEGLVSVAIGRAGVKVTTVRNDMYAALRASDAAVVASGTATLETALIGTPMVIVYKMSRPSYIIGRLLIGVERIGLPNIVAGGLVVPELIQGDATAANIAGELSAMLGDTERQRAVADGYARIRERLSLEGSAPARAARAVFEILGGAGKARRKTVRL